MNKAILMGRLARDPDVRYTQGNPPLAVAIFSLAVNRISRKEGEPEADFFNVTAFGKQAEFAEKYLRKGIKILLTGRLQNNNYTNRTGERVYSVNILAEGIEFAESKAVSGAEQRQSEAEDGFMNLPEEMDDELPFN